MILSVFGQNGRETMPQDNNRNAFILMKRPLPNLGKQALFLSNHNLTYARLPALGIS